jgi:DNA-binding XRE family transcriptional regulator
MNNNIIIKNTMKQTKKQITVKHIAKRCNISEQTYYNWKKEKPELIKLIQMGLDMEDIIEKYNTKIILENT